MGHIMIQRSFALTATKTEVYDELNEGLLNEGCRYGFDGVTKYLDKVFASYEEASDYLDAHTKGYESYAVKYRYLPYEKVTSKALTALKERKKTIIAKRNEYSEAHAVKTFKAEFVGCSGCGSKLARVKLRGDECPLCRTDLRGKTTLETLAKYKASIAEIDEKIKAEEVAIIAKSKEATLLWLVSADGHC